MIQGDGAAATGTGNLALDLLVLLVIIGGGTWAAVWLGALSHTEREAIFQQAVGIIPILLAQPGVFLSVKIAVAKDVPVRTRFVLATAVFLGFALALPMGFAHWAARFSLNGA